jgi:hypothetical protein
MMTLATGNNTADASNMVQGHWVHFCSSATHPSAYVCFHGHHAHHACHGLLLLATAAAAAAAAAADTLHRFCKKEYDWGWKKFMELGKVLDGFTVGDSLVIKAQVQVIL